jgi:hypothetical protein
MYSHAVLINKEPPSLTACRARAEDIRVDVVPSTARCRLRTTNKEGTAVAAEIGVLRIARSARAGTGSVVDGRRVYSHKYCVWFKVESTIPPMFMTLARGVAPPSLSGAPLAAEPLVGEERKKSGDCVEAVCSLEFLGVA